MASLVPRVASARRGVSRVALCHERVECRERAVRRERVVCRERKCRERKCRARGVSRARGVLRALVWWSETSGVLGEVRQAGELGGVEW